MSGYLSSYTARITRWPTSMRTCGLAFTGRSHALLKVSPAETSRTTCVAALQRSAVARYHGSRDTRAEWDGVKKDILAMPSLSPTMTQGMISSWVKNEGDGFKAGDALAEIETDKSTVSLDAADDGYLAKILVPAHQPNIEVEAPIAILVKRQEDVAKFSKYTSESSPQKEETPAPVKKEMAGGEAPKAGGDDAHQQGSYRLFASPRARALARENQLDLCQIQGSGQNQRVIAKDVLERCHQNVKGGAERTEKPRKTAERDDRVEEKVQISSESTDYVDLNLNKIRRITAERLAASKATIPHYYLSVDIGVDALLQTKSQLQTFLDQKQKKSSSNNAGDDSASPRPLKLSINDFIIKAAAATLTQHPVVNSEWRGDCIRQYKDVHINVAVNTEYGLLTPIVRHANTKGIGDIAGCMAELVSCARKNKLTPVQLSTGTFTISNLGMFGIQQFSAVINPPQAAILAVGSAYDRAVIVDDDLFANKKFIQVTLSADHRVVDGAAGAAWLQTFKDLIEQPIKLLL